MQSDPPSQAVAASAMFLLMDSELLRSCVEPSGFHYSPVFLWGVTGIFAVRSFLRQEGKWRLGDSRPTGGCTPCQESKAGKSIAPHLFAAAKVLGAVPGTKKTH